jgi:hypothetical protein
MQIEKRDAKLIQEWFCAVQDLNPSFFRQKDYGLAARIYAELGERVPDSVLFPAVKPNA